MGLNGWGKEKRCPLCLEWQNSFPGWVKHIGKCARRFRIEYGLEDVEGLTEDTVLRCVKPGMTKGSLQAALREGGASIMNARIAVERLGEKLKLGYWQTRGTVSVGGYELTVSRRPKGSFRIENVSGPQDKNIPTLTDEERAFKRAMGEPVPPEPKAKPIQDAQIEAMTEGVGISVSSLYEKVGRDRACAWLESHGIDDYGVFGEYEMVDTGSGGLLRRVKSQG